MVVDAKTAGDTVLEIGTAANQPAAGAGKQLDALRHLEIAQLELRQHAPASLEVYFALSTSPSTFDATKVALLGSVADARPASSGKYMLQLQQKYDCKQEMLGFLCESF